MSPTQQTPPKRPRLSLQIKAISSGPNLRASRTIAAVVNPTSPTSFNTLSNVYATAIDRSGTTPVTAINTKGHHQQQSLKLQTQNLAPQHQQPWSNSSRKPDQTTPYGMPLAPSYPDTPLTAQPISPAVANRHDFRFPSSMTATPPLSAGPIDSNGGDNKVFSFNPAHTSSTYFPPQPANPTASSTTPTTPAPHPSHHHRGPTPSLCVSRPALPLPYTRNRALHSILRNSPLPPPSAKTPTSPEVRRQSARLAARRVCYHSPIEQEIVNDRYVRSHIDLLLNSPLEQQQADAPAAASPISPVATTGGETPLSLFMPRDGGMTPGPFEEMRRRMAGLVAGGRTPTSPTAAAGSPTGIRKRSRRKERSRRWVWTIGTQDDDEEGEVGGAVLMAAAAEQRQQQQQQQHEKKSLLLPVVKVVEQQMLDSPMDIATPSIETFEDAAAVGVRGEEQVEDVLMYESEPDAETAGELVLDQRRALSLTPADADADFDMMVTPTVASGVGGGGGFYGRLQPFCFAGANVAAGRQGSESLFNPDTGSRRDTPVPTDLVAG